MFKVNTTAKAQSGMNHGVMVLVHAGINGITYEAGFRIDAATSLPHFGSFELAK